MAMATSWGANLDEMEALAQALGRASDRLGQISRELNSALHSDV